MTIMEENNFLQEIDVYSLEELELIYEQQKDLYSEEELKIIKGKIDQLKCVDQNEINTSGKGRGWILLFKGILWIVLIGFFVVGILLLTFFAEDGKYGYGVLLLFICIIAGLFTIAGGMMILDAMENLRRCATNSALILEYLQTKNKR